MIALNLRQMKRRNLRPSTIAQRRNTLLLFARTLNGRGLLEATFDDLQDHLDRDSLGAEAVATETSHLKSFYKWAHVEGLITEDPSIRLVRPRLARRLPRPMATADLVRALTEAPDRVRPWLYLAAYAGLRACEIAALRREDIIDNQDPPVIVVIDGKGGKQRIIPMPGELVAEFQTWPMPAGGGWLFTKRDARGNDLPEPCPPHLVSIHSNRFLHSIGIDSTLHTLRHWYGTTVYGRSKDLRLTQELMGHSSPVTTAGYAAWSPADGAAVVTDMRAGVMGGGDDPPRFTRESHQRMAVLAGGLDGESIGLFFEDLISTGRMNRRDVVEAHAIARRSMLTNVPMPDDGACGSHVYEGVGYVAPDAAKAVAVLAEVLAGLEG